MIKIITIIIRTIKNFINNGNNDNDHDHDIDNKNSNE